MVKTPALKETDGNGYKGDFTDPPAWPGFQYRRQWTAAIRRWNKLTDVPMYRRAEKVLRTLGWELQVDFEHLTEEQLASDRYLDYILAVLELKAGVVPIPTPTTCLEDLARLDDYFGFVLDVVIAVVGPDFGWDAGSAHFVGPASRTAQHFIGYSFRGMFPLGLSFPG